MKTDDYFDILLKLAVKASKKNEVPISALIVKDNKVIAKAYNKRNKTNNVLDHAEIIVINKACKKLKNWRLTNCDLYVTLKPCSMCESVIAQTRLANVYYLIDKPLTKKEYYKTKISKANIYTIEKEYCTILKAFFQKKRDKK